MVRKDGPDLLAGRPWQTSRVQQGLVRQRAQSLMRVYELDALAKEDVSEERMRGEELREGCLCAGDR